ncbi:helix-turn-helix transcriptional regulator [Streptomyces sp900116325]|uniref:helix-turn-helix domain-containing protein n=1 Tax=Streptomyces sp. 900116325 TaxID=3154295 RepID=UPI00339EADFA
MTKSARPEPPLTASIGEWLRWALPRHGYDLEERGARARFAEASSIPVATVSRLLRDAGSPDARTLLTVAEVLNVPVMPLLARAGLVPLQELMDSDGRPLQPPTKISSHDALAALGVTEEADQAAVLSMIRALRAKGESAP